MTFSWVLYKCRMTYEFKKWTGFLFYTVVFSALLVFVLGCDIEGEVKEGKYRSNIAPHSGAAGGHEPVLGGVYFDNKDGLSISKGGEACTFLRLSADDEPEWVALDDTSCDDGNQQGQGHLKTQSYVFSDKGLTEAFNELWRQNELFKSRIINLEDQLKSIEEKLHKD